MNTYEQIDDRTYMTVHDVLKYCQHGYSRVTDSLSREIRFKRISKKDAKAIENFYQKQNPETEIEKFLNWLGMTKKAFNWYNNNLSHKFRNTKQKNIENRNHINFISLFVTSGPHVETNKPYTIFGKGIS